MGLLNLREARVNPFENPSVPLTDVALLQMFGSGGTESGVNISEQSAMTFTAVWRCVNLLAGLVAGLPLKTYRYSDKSEVLVRSLTSPGVGMTPFERWETVMTHLLLWGNAYVLKIRNGAGSIVELAPIHPGRVAVKLAGALSLSGVNAHDKVFEIKGDDGTPKPYTSYDIMHIPGLSYDGLTGMSCVQAARQAIGIGVAADSMAARLYSNGNLMSGFLTSDRVLTQDQADALKSRWREKMAGLAHAHDVAVLDAGTKFAPLSMPPDQAQFLESRKWQVVEVARAFGIPPHLVGDVERSTSWGKGIEEQNLGLITFVLRGWTTRIEQRVTREVVEPSTQYAEFLLDGLLRGDTTERYAAYATAIQWGWMTRNEARAKENLQPIPGLDEPLTPLNMSTSVLGETPVVGAGIPPDSEDPNADDSSTRSIRVLPGAAAL